MTRQIKFRVWTGSTMEENVLVGKLGAFYASKDSSDTASAVTTLYPENIPVMQFTGSVDRNGKEIYEGDIVDLGKGFTPQYRPIVYTEYGSWSIGHIGIGFGSMKANGFVYCEIIGNIHENPELLEVKN